MAAKRLTNQAERLAWVEIKHELLLKQMSPKLLTRRKNGRLLRACTEKSGVNVRTEQQQANPKAEQLMTWMDDPSVLFSASLP